MQGVVDRLAQQYPEIHAKLLAMAPVERHRCAKAIAEHVLATTGQAHPPKDRADAEAAVQLLDEQAWEAEGANPETYASLFSRARAMNAWLLARFDDRPTEAVYEAMATSADQALIVSFIDGA